MPTCEPYAYRIYPTDYNNLVMSDKHTTILYVVNEHSDATDGWTIRIGAVNSPRILDRNGTIHLDHHQPDNKLWRFPKEEAVHHAINLVDTYQPFNGMNVHQASAYLTQRRTQEES